MDPKLIWSIFIIIMLHKPETCHSELTQLKLNVTHRPDPLSSYFPHNPLLQLSSKGSSDPQNRRNNGWMPMPLPYYPGGKNPGFPQQQLQGTQLFKQDAPHGRGRPFHPRAIHLQPPRPPMFHPVPHPTPPQGLKIMRPSQPEPIAMGSSNQENIIQHANHKYPIIPPQRLSPLIPYAANPPIQPVPASYAHATPQKQPAPAPYGPAANSIDTRPNTEADPPKTAEEQSELRFLFHRPEDEDLIKSTIRDESEKYNERVSFIRGPTLKFQRRQTIYLPPRKKSVIYVMLKEPQVQTDLEIVEPALDPTPEVNIIYEQTGPVKTKHYYSTAEKHAGPLSEQHLGSGSEISSVTVVPPSTVPPLLVTQQFQGRSLPPPNPCQPNFSKKLRK